MVVFLYDWRASTHTPRHMTQIHTTGFNQIAEQNHPQRSQTITVKVVITCDNFSFISESLKLIAKAL